MTELNVIHDSSPLRRRELADGQPAKSFLSADQTKKWGEGSLSVLRCPTHEVTSIGSMRPLEVVRGTEDTLMHACVQGNLDCVRLLGGKQTSIGGAGMKFADEELVFVEHR